MAQPQGKPKFKHSGDVHLVDNDLDMVAEALAPDVDDTSILAVEAPLAVPGAALPPIDAPLAGLLQGDDDLAGAGTTPRRAQSLSENPATDVVPQRPAPAPRLQSGSPWPAIAGVAVALLLLRRLLRR